MKKFIALICVLAIGTSCEQGKSTIVEVQTGLDVLVKNDFDRLIGKWVGVITNHTGLTKEGDHIADLLYEAEGVELVALFGPEHGVRGVEPGGERISSKVDSATGVPIYSLYGNTRRPTEPGDPAFGSASKI